MSEFGLAMALACLTMDCVTLLGEQLWITQPLERWRKQPLRELIQSGTRDGSILTHYSYLCASTYQFFRRNDAAAWPALYGWAESVFLHNDRRTAEQVWSLIVLDYRRARRFGGLSEIRPLGGEVLSRLDLIESQLMMSSDNRSEQMKKVMAAPVSGWDSTMLAQMDMTCEQMADLLDGMCEYNALIDSWRAVPEFSFKQLMDLYHWAQGRAVGIGLREVDVPFPGSWEYSPMNEKGRH